MLNNLTSRTRWCCRGFKTASLSRGEGCATKASDVVPLGTSSGVLPARYTAEHAACPACQVSYRLCCLPTLSREGLSKLSFRYVTRPHKANQCLDIPVTFFSQADRAAGTQCCICCLHFKPVTAVVASTTNRQNSCALATKWKFGMQETGGLESSTNQFCGRL